MKSTVRKWQDFGEGAFKDTADVKKRIKFHINYLFLHILSRMCIMKDEAEILASYASSLASRLNSAE